MNIRINTKLLIYILGSSSILFLSILAITTYKTQKDSYNNSKDIIDNYVQQYATYSSGILNEYMNTTKSLGIVFENFESLPDSSRRHIMSTSMARILEESKSLLSVWSILEPNSIDNLDELYKNKPGSTILGNFKYVYYKKNGEIALNQYIEQNKDEVLSGDIYKLLKNNKIETITNPHNLSTENKKHENLETNIVVPVIIRDKFIGVIGIVVPLNILQEAIDQIKPFKNSFAFLIANSGDFVTHPNKNNIGKNFAQLFPIQEEDFLCSQKIKVGSSFSYIAKTKDEINYYYSYAPVIIGNTQTPWSLGIAIPTKIIIQSAYENLKISIILGIIGLIILLVIILIVSKQISKPIVKATQILKQISLGDISEKNRIHSFSHNEISEIEKSVNSLIENLDKTNKFASEIGKGDFNTDFKLISEEDNLGKSLLEMRNNLKLSNEENNKRQRLEHNQGWIAHGIAKLGEIIRQNNNNLELLTSRIIQFLINYLQANQGAFFVINDNDPDNIFYTLTALIGYDSDSNIQKTYKIGEGLIGKCIYEKELIYTIEIPNDYIYIASGLGKSKPQSILINPLVVNETVLGVLQIDSFSKLQDYEIDFIIKVNESIASSINSVRINERTNQLLEQSQQQSEELAAQEEEMRQNMEEIQATQEEASKREESFLDVLNSLKKATCFAEYNYEAQLVDCNTNYIQLLSLTQNEAIGKYHWIVGSDTQINIDSFKTIWDELRSGKSVNIQREISQINTKITILEKLSPIFDQGGNPIKFLCIATQLNDFVNHQLKNQ